MLDDFRLKVFMSVASCGSFTAAARELGVSQPAVSQNIAELEKLVGVKLLERSRSGVELTARGELFKEYARRILDAYRIADDSFSAPKSILIKDVCLDGRITNILIMRNCFADLNVPDDTHAERTIDAAGLAIVPPFFNAHSSSAMTRPWGEQVSLEQILSGGTAFLADVPDDVETTVRCVEDSLIRAAIGIRIPDDRHARNFEQIKDFVRAWSDPTEGRIQLMFCHGSIVATGEEMLRKSASFARKYGIRMMLNLSRSKAETEECLRARKMTPAAYLDSIGYLGKDVLVSGCEAMDERDWKILAKRAVTVIHTPLSGLENGYGRFPYELAAGSGCRIVLGTDHLADGLSLDMRQEARAASMFSRIAKSDHVAAEEEAFVWATKNGADAFGIDSGVIAAGKLADAVLVDLGDCRLQPADRLVRNLVASADSSCVRYVICDGRVLIQPQVS